MFRRTALALPVLIAFALNAADGPDKIGAIDFFGHKGIDVEVIRRALPVQEGAALTGDPFSEELRTAIDAAVTRASGLKATEVGYVCCDPTGGVLIFIGLPGATYVPVAVHPRPTGKQKLPKRLMEAQSRVEDAWLPAVMSGQIAEDRSAGYSLLKEPKARAAQLAFRDEARRQQGVLYSVLKSSANDELRAIAAEAVGYLAKSDRQILALVEASRDPSGDVRNNATRALAVLGEAFPDVRAKTPRDLFLKMLTSGTWTDRNKGAAVVEEQTRSGQVPIDLRSPPVLDALIEMARWKSAGHASYARIILARMVGKDPAGMDLNDAANLDELIRAATSAR